jgi:pimeloyl-ACP methyl ester carboxylesterase
MADHRNYLLLAAVGALLAACQAGSPSQVETVAEGVRQYGQIGFQPCTLTATQAAGNVEALCGKWKVAENPAQPDGRQIELNIAWLAPDDGQLGKEDPVFFLAGGPGQAATEVATLVAGPLREVRKKRDIILIDQRGTGGSNPLSCLDAQGKPMAFDESAGLAAEQIRDYAAACLEGVAKRADARFYTTGQAIDDLDAVRAALGVEQINLIGASYGTRVAQQYAARYRQHTRALVLDGVVPNDLVVGAEFANTFQRAIEAQAALCRADAACSARFPVDTVTQLRSVVADLKAHPRTVDYRDPATAQWRREPLPAEAVTGLAFAFSYVPQMSALLPVVLDEAAHGRYDGLAALSRMAGSSMAGQINRGMQWSVICAEDDDRQASAASTADTLLGPEVVELFYAACQVWPRGERAPGFTVPLSTSAPTLLLSGELDPVTPPAYAAAVAEHLPAGRALVARGRGHGTLSAGCMPSLLGQFVDSADAKALDTSCLDTLRPVLPFTSFNGWEP